MKKMVFMALAFAAIASPVAASVATDSLSASPAPLYEVIGNDTSCNIFLYSPGQGEGLHVAYLTDKEQWHDMGQLCRPDTETGMLNPYVCHAADGSWRLLFGTGGKAEDFGAAYSEDLVTWRPQDFPRMGEAGISRPVMFQMDDGTFDIYVKAGDGTRRYVKGDKDFRHFDEADEASSISDDAWIMDTATVAGRCYDGNQFEVPKVHLDYMMHYLAAMANDNRLYAESMKDDGIRFAGLGSSVNATLTVDASRTKAISGKLIGIALAGLSHEGEGALSAELLGATAMDGFHHAFSAKGDTLSDRGWGGIKARPSEAFDFSVDLRAAGNSKNQLLVTLAGDNGEVYAKEKIKVQGNGWQHYSLPLVVDKKANEANVRLLLTLQKDGKVEAGKMSLMPHETFKGHGMRSDIAEAIAAIHPAMASLPADSLLPGSRLYDYMQFCKDICAEPVPVFGLDEDEPASACSGKILRFMQWASNDSVPFSVRYVGIGNGCNRITTGFEENFLSVVKTIKQKYPNVTICGTVGAFPYPSPGYTEGWRFARANRNAVGMVGENCHEQPGWMLHHQDYYDNYDRNAQKVMLGSWGSCGGTMEDALAEALYLCGMERNGDVVECSGCEPLLYFNRDTITSLTPSYYTQRLWGRNAGNTYIQSAIKVAEDNLAYRIGSSVVRDNDGQISVKLVNALPCPLVVSISGMAVADGTPVAGFTGKPSGREVNLVNTTVKGQTVTLPPYSVVVIGKAR